MQTHETLLSLLGRTIALLREGSEAGNDLEVPLQGLVDLTGQHSLTLRADDAGLTVEGQPVGPDVPFADQVAKQLDAHGIVEVRLAHRAAAVDLLEFLRSVSRDPSDFPVLTGSSRDSTVIPIARIDDAKAEERRRIPVAKALGRPGAASIPVGQPVAGLQARGPAAAPETPVRTREQPAPSPSPESPAVQKVTGGATGQELLERVEALEQELTAAIEGGRVPQAIDGMTALVRAEAEAAEPDLRRALGGSLRRLLTERRLKALGRFLLDELYAADVRAIASRAGEVGTTVLLDLLVEAPTFAERRAYLAVLRGVAEGTQAITGMLGHPTWYVVRNMADLAGDLRIEEAVEALGRVADHPDDRVRRSVGAALAKIGTAAAARYVLRMVQDADDTVKVTVFREVGGGAFGALAVPLISALEREQNPEVRREYYRALGRIGTPGAIDALKKTAVRPSGLLRRPSADQLAAVEALGLSASDAARSALRELSSNGARDVRDAAQKALGGGALGR